MFSQIARNLPRSETIVPLMAIRKDRCSINFPRRRVFTQPRPKVDAPLPSRRKIARLGVTAEDIVQNSGQAIGIHCFGSPRPHLRNRPRPDRSRFPRGRAPAPIGTGLVQAALPAFDELLARSEVAGSLEIRLLSEGGLGLLHG
jgi:hypothetical protein